MAAAALGVACAPAVAQTAEFDAPVRITAGGDNFSKILYPSPVLFDVDGNGARDLVFGDLPGNLRSCAPDDDADELTWAAMTNLQSEGKPLKLHNW